MVLNRIHERHPLYKACSLVDILIVAAVCFTLTTFVTLIIAYGFHHLIVGVITSVPLSYLTTWLALHRLSTIKAGKPKGYTTQWCQRQWQRLPWVNGARVVRSGRWRIAP